MRWIRRLRSATSRVRARLASLRTRLPQPGSGRFRILAAALIGCAALTGSLGAWRAEEAARVAEDVERRGLDNVAADQQARAEIASSLQAIAFDYLRAQSAKATATELIRAAVELDSRGAAEDSLRLAFDGAVANAFAGYVLDRIEPDAFAGQRLDLVRKYQIEYRQAGEELDLDPGPEFERADDARRKSARLVGLTTLVIAAALFVTLAQVGRLGPPLLYLGAGILVLVAGGSLLLVLGLGT